MQAVVVGGLPPCLRRRAGSRPPRISTRPAAADTPLVQRPRPAQPDAILAMSGARPSLVLVVDHVAGCVLEAPFGLAAPFALSLHPGADGRFLLGGARRFGLSGSGDQDRHYLAPLRAGARGGAGAGGDRRCSKPRGDDASAARLDRLTRLHEQILAGGRYGSRAGQAVSLVLPLTLPAIGVIEKIF